MFFFWESLFVLSVGILFVIVLMTIRNGCGISSCCKTKMKVILFRNNIFYQCKRCGRIFDGPEIIKKLPQVPSSVDGPGAPQGAR
jgi:hypothetical protein